MYVFPKFEMALSILIFISFLKLFMTSLLSSSSIAKAGMRKLGRGKTREEGERKISSRHVSFSAFSCATC